VSGAALSATLPPAAGRTAAYRIVADAGALRLIPD
jgi:hypothetical protein